MESNSSQGESFEAIVSGLSDSDFTPQLANWTAKDFSDFYVRYFPHLLRYARKFLQDSTAAEEAVQDAFLYLMASLPEVDSEIGVLRLLKWKVRNIAIDVTRLSAKSPFPISEELQIKADQPELDEALTRADDAAIVALAMAKLTPNQRQALIATTYHEKSIAQVADEMSISDNAAKQLVHRAKNAFKRALVGEAETAGLTMNEVLSIAAKKAAKNAAKYVSVASASLVALALSIFGFMTFNTVSTSEVASDPIISRDSVLPQAPLADSPPANSVEASGSQTTPGASSGDSEIAQNVPSNSDGIEIVNASQTSPAVTQQASRSTPEAVVSLASSKESRAISRASLSPYLGLSVMDAELETSGTDFLPSSNTIVKIHSGVGLWAYVMLDPDGPKLSGAALEIMVDGQKYFASPRQLGSSTVQSSDGFTLTLSATELFLIDSDRNVHTDHDLASSFVTISLELDENQNPLSATLFITEG